MSAVTLLTELDAFYLDPCRCGELQAGLDGPVVWIACACRASMARRAEDEHDDPPSGYLTSGPPARARSTENFETCPSHSPGSRNYNGCDATDMRDARVAARRFTPKFLDATNFRPYLARAREGRTQT